MNRNPKTHCIRGHEWTLENTRPKPKTLKSGRVAIYRECRLCVNELIATGIIKASNKAARIALANMAVVTDDWSAHLDCPRCHALLATDEDGDTKCMVGHSPRARLQAVMSL